MTSPECKGKKINVNRLNRPDYRFESINMAVNAVEPICLEKLSERELEERAKHICELASRFFDYLHNAKKG